MEAYTGFAEVYDLFMDDVPYEVWCAYVVRRLKEHGINDGLVLDLGCGTGSLTRLLAREGYDMIGADSSEDMLALARAKDADGSILYLAQDMRELELYGTVRAVVSLCDSLNYIRDEEELCGVFRLVNNYLDPGGIFLFDMNTPYKYEAQLADHTFAEDREEAGFIWSNDYDEETQLNYYDLSIFVREDSGLYRKYTETHIQRAYAPELVEKLLRQAGMELLSVYGEDGVGPLTKKSGRMYFIAREKGKNCDV